MRWKIWILFLATIMFFSLFATANLSSSSSTTIVVDVQNSTGAKIFVKAIYPDGIRELQPVAKRGNMLYIDISSLRKAWEDNVKKHSYGAEPFLVLTIVKDGKVAVHGVSVSKNHEKITIVPHYRPLQTSNVSLTSTGDVQIMDSYWEVLEEFRETTIPVVVAEVINSDFSWGQITYSYMANARAGFGVYIFANADWSRLGTYYTYNVNGGAVSHVAFNKGDDVYVWMDFTYRYERWVIHIDGQNFYEEYLFVKSFDPSSLSWGHYRPSTVRPAPINSWNLIGRYYSTTYTYPYYSFSLGDLSSDAFSIDALGFISMLSTAGVISSSAAVAASSADLVIDVVYEYNSIQAFTCTLDLYGESGNYHAVWRGDAKTNIDNINTVPVIGFYVSNGLVD